MAALTAVGFFADRLSSGLARDAGQLLGGDAVVASEAPVPANNKEGGKEGGKEGAKDGAKEGPGKDAKPEAQPTKAERSAS